MGWFEILAEASNKDEQEDVPPFHPYTEIEAPVEPPYGKKVGISFRRGADTEQTQCSSEHLFT